MALCHMTDSTLVGTPIDFLFLDGPAEDVLPGIVVKTGGIVGRFNRGADQFCIFDRGCPVGSGGELSRALIKEYLTV